MARPINAPRGWAVTSFVSTAMVVAGIGLALDGLLLALAGFVLGMIDWNRFQAANPTLFPDPKTDPEAAAALVTAGVAKVSLLGTVSMFAFGLAALALVQTGDERLLALPPAAVGAAVGVVIQRRLMALLAGPR